MSIQSEITRISGNVSDALDAIENKGVTIPSGANSDDLADLIAQITGGGSAVGGITQDQDGYLVLDDEAPSGGGSGFPATLIKTLTVPENVNAFQFEYDSTMAAYDFVYAMMDFELTESDWLYYSVGGVNETYGGSHAVHKYPILIISGDGIRRALWPNLTALRSISSGNTVNIHTYVATKYITAGSTITFWGWNYADI